MDHLGLPLLLLLLLLLRLLVVVVVGHGVLVLMLVRHGLMLVRHGLMLVVIHPMMLVVIHPMTLVNGGVSMLVGPMLVLLQQRCLRHRRVVVTGHGTVEVVHRVVTMAAVVVA